MERERKKRKMANHVEMTFHREIGDTLTREVPSPPDIKTMEMGAHPYGVPSYTSYPGYSAYAGQGYGAKSVHWSNPCMKSYYNTSPTNAWDDTDEGENDTVPTDWDDVAKDLGLDDWQTEGQSLEDEDPYQMYTIYYRGEKLFDTYCRQSELMDKVTDLLTTYCNYYKLPLVPIEQLDVREDNTEVKEQTTVQSPFLSPFNVFTTRPPLVTELDIHGFDLDESRTTGDTIKLPVYNRMPVYQLLMDARAETNKAIYALQNKRVTYDFLARFGMYSEPGDFFVFYQNKLSIWGMDFTSQNIRKKVDDLKGLFYYFKTGEDDWACSRYKNWSRCLCCSKTLVTQKDNTWFCWYCNKDNDTDYYCCKCRSAHSRSWDPAVGQGADCVTICPVATKEQSSGETSRLVAFIYRGITAGQVKQKLREALDKRLVERNIQVANCCLITNGAALVPDHATITHIDIGQPVGKLVQAIFTSSQSTVVFESLAFRFTVSVVRTDDDVRLARYWNLLRRVEDEKARVDAPISLEVLCCQQPDGLVFNVDMRVPDDTAHHEIMTKAEELVKKKLAENHQIMESGSMTFEWSNKDRPLVEQSFIFKFRAEDMLDRFVPIQEDDELVEIPEPAKAVLMVNCVQTPAHMTFTLNVCVHEGMDWTEVQNIINREAASFLMKKSLTLGVGAVNSYASEHGDVSLVRIVKDTVLMSRRVDGLPTSPSLTYIFTLRSGTFAPEA